MTRARLLPWGIAILGLGFLTWFFVAALDWKDARVQQGVVAGVFLAGGWVVNGWENRRSARALRAERLRDLHRAIYAEIDANLRNLGTEEDLEQHKQRMLARIAKEDSFVPYVPHEHHDRLFKAILDDISILPRTSIDAVVLYYNQLEVISGLVSDMRSEGYAKLKSARKSLMYDDYIDMKKQLLWFGYVSMSLIEAYESGRNEFQKKQNAQARLAELQAESINNPVGDRSGL